MRRKWVIVLVAIGAVAVIGAAIGAAAWLVFTTDPELGRRALAEIGVGGPDARGLRASGFIEADEADVASELGGRIVELLVAEGDVVEAGETLLQLDTTLIDAQIAMARARVATAEAELARVQASPHPDQVRQAQSAVELARRMRDGAYQAWQDLLALQDNPQDLNVEIAQARWEVEAARAAVSSAEALKDAAKIGYDAFHEAREEIQEAQERWEEIPEPQRPPKPELDVQLSFHLLPNQYWQAWIALDRADVRLEAARTALRDLFRARDNPQELLAEVDAAETRYAAAERRVEQAEARLDALQAGATAEQVALQEARVREAQAELTTLMGERAKLTVTAPMGGVILRQRLDQGELAAPGATILALGNLDQVTLTVFVPVPRLGDVSLGQDVVVRTDSYPDRVFTGKVVAIAEQAEFAPREIEIREDRMNLVFGVDIRIPNPDHALKPGAYAQAHFGPGSSASAPPRVDDGVRTAAGRDVLTASGFIEGTEVSVAAEVGGRVAELPVRRGDAVMAGEVVVRLEDAALQNQSGEAQAGLAAAEANLAMVGAGARAEEIAAASAELAEAQVLYAGAVEAVVHAREAITNPQALDARVNQARHQVALAERNVDQAQAELEAVELKRDVYAEESGDVERTWDLQVEAAEAALRAAEAELRGARAALGALMSMRDNPLELQAELHRAETEAESAEIEVEMRQARVDELRAGPTAEELAVAEQHVAAARAAVALVDARLTQLTLQAPLSGVVSNRLAQVGEAAVAGRRLLTIANLDQVTLAIYVPHRYMARVQIGRPVSITVKALPERVFSGHVSRISGEAEFTPSDVLTEEERVSLVFAVDVSIPNPDHVLRPGMPAEAALSLREP